MIDNLNLLPWYRSNTLESSCEASAMLLQVVTRRVSERDEQFLNLLKAAFSFALYSLHCLEEHVSSSGQEIIKHVIDRQLQMVKTELNKWITQIWSNSFGAPKHGYFNPDQARKEIKVSLQLVLKLSLQWNKTQLLLTWPLKLI